MTIPGALLFFDFQRYLVRWASGGAVKGGRPGRASASPTRTHAKRAFPARSRPRRGAEALTVPRFRGTAEPVNGRGLVRSESISPARGHDGSSRWNVTTMAWMRGRSRRGGDTRYPAQLDCRLAWPSDPSRRRFHGPGSDMCWRPVLKTGARSTKWRRVPGSASAPPCHQPRPRSAAGAP